MSIHLASDIEKLKLFDQLFTALTVDEIKNAIGADLVVGKLRDCPTSQGPIMEIVDELVSLRTETMNLRSELMNYRSDMSTMLRCIGKPYESVSQNDMSSLRQRFGVY